MYRVSNFTDNDDVKTLDQKGPFTVIEYQRDLSVTPGSAVTAFYCAQMNVKKRQVICDLNHANITIQAGAMQCPCYNKKNGSAARKSSKRRWILCANISHKAKRMEIPAELSPWLITNGRFPGTPKLKPPTGHTYLLCITTSSLAARCQALKAIPTPCL